MKKRTNYFWSLSEKGFFVLKQGDLIVFEAHAFASDVQGRMIDTRYDKLIDEKIENNECTYTYEADNGLVLKEYLRMNEFGIPYAYCSLGDKSGEEVETRNLVPLIMRGAADGSLNLWKSLWTQMLLVPYDNDMWLRYEATPLRAGRKSYDLTVLFSEETKEGLLIGALDFDVWKNGMVCSAYDAKCVEARCGMADEGTHDREPHGTIIGKEVVSSRFCVLYGEDYRELLEEFGELISMIKPPMAWEEGVPFGFNSWAGLATSLNEKDFRATGAFLREKLVPNSYENKGISYMNMDAFWHTMTKETLDDMRNEIHGAGQKAGIYDVPFCFFGQDIHAQLPGVPGHTYEEILLKDALGNILPRVDGGIPMDVTHPLWKMHMEFKAKRYVEGGYDYLKTDFISHGGMEGVHYDKNVRTGRQALKAGYEFMNALYAPEKIGREFFLSLSIAPLFPCGNGHARRFSCDAFGTNEDVEYVLNAQTWSWWQNGRLYAFNDPDHICLERSFCMDRSSTEGEAKARYTAAAIAGSVMMLSDDYKSELAKERAIRYATNPKVNKIAASRVSFRPISSGGVFASYGYYANIEDTKYAAIFHWADKKEVIKIKLADLDCPKDACFEEVWSGETWQCIGDELVWEAEGCDVILLELK